MSDHHARATRQGVTAIAALVIGCGSAPPVATPPASPTPAPPASPEVLRRKGVAHDVATRLASAIDAGDAAAAAATFDPGGVLVRYRGTDVRGPAGVEPVFRQAFGLCKMHVVTILEREAALVMEIASSCTHPDSKLDQNHLLAIDLVADRITRAAVWTELFGARFPTAPLRREVEDPATLTADREHRTACVFDSEREMLPKDFVGLERDVWATPTCTVLVVRGDEQHRAAHGYLEVDCGARGAECKRTASSHRYVDWNGYRLLPFADEVYTAKPKPLTP